MRIFVTGATGFVGSAVVSNLLAHGHEVLGLVRSEAGATALSATGAAVHHGSIYDLDSLRAGARDADGVIHTAFNHDFSRYVENCETDRTVVTTLANALAGSDRPLVVTSGTALVQVGRPAVEDDRAEPGRHPRIATDEAVEAALERGINASLMRLPPTVHGLGDHGFVPMLIEVARQKGFSAYIGDGANRWAAVHRSDAGDLYRLAIEAGVAGARYHAVAEEGIAFADIAAAIGRGLGLTTRSIRPEDAAEHFGWMAGFVNLDAATSSEKTRRMLGWVPTGPTLLQDLADTAYFGG